jgi:hypothetical protein
MRIEVAEVVEDSSNVTFTATKIDRAMNRVARRTHAHIIRKAGIKYARAIYTLNTVAGTYAYPLEGVDDLQQAHHFTTDSDSTGALGRGVIGSEITQSPRLIPESQRNDPQHLEGVDGSGRPLAFMKFDPESANEVVRLTITGGPSSGTWTFTFDGQTTGALAYAISTTDLQTALLALSSIGTGNVIVTGTAGDFYDVEFTGSLKLTDVGAITTADGFDTGEVTVAVTTTGAAMWAVEFLTSLVGAWDLVYSKKCREITPGVDATNDALRYETIPEFWHDVVVYGTAVSLLGIHNESGNDITIEYVNLMREMDEALLQGTASGFVKEEASGW